LTMTLGEFIEVLEQSRQASPAQRFAPRDPSGAPVRQTEPAEREQASAFSSAPVHFPVELTEPGPVDLPPIAQEGRGRPSGLTNARAQRIVEMACTGASIPVCAAAAGVTPNTLKSWLRRKDHEAFLAFQRYFAEAVTYATLATLKAIMEGVAADPRHAFEFLARRHPDHWGTRAVS
jgi:transposase-like protein